MRNKENADDYRYFPEPDMPALKVRIPEVSEHPLPSRYIKTCKEFGFHKEYINALLTDKALFDFFFAEVEKGFSPKAVAKWIA